MKINVALPFGDSHPPEEFLSMEAVSQIGAALERAGFHAGLATDHPCPTGRWLDAGGHPAPGPFVMLALLGAVTTQIRLQTSVLVLPYRNPFAVARDIATLDRFSGGRVTLGVGAGYLEGEYRAVGVDFGRRNDLMNEYIRALRTSLTGAEFSFEGSHYTANGNRITPGPAQQPLPIVAGGNSKRAIRRAVDLCDGWNPFFTGNSGFGAGTTRTSAMTGEGDVREGIEYLRDYCERTGRADPPAVELGGINSPFEDISSQELLDRLCRYRELGVAAASVIVKGRSRAEWCDNAALIGVEVIAKL